MAYDDGEKKESDLTKPILSLVLIGAVVFLGYQNYQKNEQLNAVVEAQRHADEQKATANLKLEIRKESTARVEAERARDQAINERDNALRERDEARTVATSVRDELARVTNSVPRPLTWFEQRQAGSGAKLDAPAAPVNARVRTYPGGVFYTP